jgi:hypothetical protein
MPENTWLAGERERSSKESGVNLKTSSGVESLKKLSA